MTARAPSPLPVLPFWQARSFWLTVLSTLSTILVAVQGLVPPLGPWIAQALPLVQDPATINAIMLVVAALAGVLAWGQRLWPRYQLGLKAVLLAALAGGLLAGPQAARAQGAACAAHELLVARLAEGWGEARLGLGLASDGAVMEVFASAETGTWTIAVTRPGGPTCIVAAGEHWEAVAEALPPPGEGA